MTCPSSGTNDTEDQDLANKISFGVNHHGAGNKGTKKRGKKTKMEKRRIRKMMESSRDKEGSR